MKKVYKDINLARGFNPDDKGITEIVVDGKLIKGNWIEGYYYEIPAPPVCFGVPDKPEGFIIFEDPHYVPDWNLPRRMVQGDVILSTVGHYTTKDDMNGKKLFVGDRVMCHGIGNNADEEYEAEVSWDDTDAAYAFDVGPEFIGFEHMSQLCEVEYIGTIWDKGHVNETGKV